MKEPQARKQKMKEPQARKQKMKEPTWTELMEAALTQCATAKKIAAELKMLLELRKIAHQKMYSRLHERVVRTK